MTEENGFGPGAPGTWLPVPDAAKAAGVPLRTAYRYSAKGLLPTRDAPDGSKLIELAVLVALKRGARASGPRRPAPTTPPPAPQPAPPTATATPANATLTALAPTAVAAATGTRHATVSGTGTGGSGTGAGSGGAAGGRASGQQPPDPAGAARLVAQAGEEAAELFGLFESGATPVEVVRYTQKAPAAVESAWREWTRLRNAVPGVSSVAERVDVVAAELAAVRGELVHDLDGLRLDLGSLRLDVAAQAEWDAAELGKSFASLSRRLDSVEAAQARLSVEVARLEVATETAVRDSAKATTDVEEVKRGRWWRSR